MLVRTYSNRDFYSLLEGCKMVNLEFGLAVYIRLNIYLFNDLEILFLGIYPREMNTYIHRKDQFKNVHSSVIHNSQIPINRREDKIYCVISITGTQQWNSMTCCLKPFQNFRTYSHAPGGAAGRLPLAVSLLGEKHPTFNAWALQSGQNLPSVSSAPTDRREFYHGTIHALMGWVHSLASVEAGVGLPYSSTPASFASLSKR